MNFQGNLSMSPFLFKSTRLLVAILLFQQIHGAPNVTTISELSNEADDDQYIAEGSDFFPNEYKSPTTSSVKFPEEESQQSQTNYQTAATSSEQLDDIDEKTAIDIILAATKSGRSFDVGDGTEELSQVTSDPKIKAQIESGNEAQARGYIRDKLCDLGLMPVRLLNAFILYAVPYF